MREKKSTKHLNLGNLFRIIVVVIVLPAENHVRAQAGALRSLHFCTLCS